MTEPNTFHLPKTRRDFHFFTREELLGQFLGYETLYIAEGQRIDLDHGDPHTHGFVEYVGRKG